MSTSITSPTNSHYSKPVRVAHDLRLGSQNGNDASPFPLFLLTLPLDQYKVTSGGYFPARTLFDFAEGIPTACFSYRFSLLRRANGKKRIADFCEAPSLFVFVAISSPMASPAVLLPSAASAFVTTTAATSNM